MTKSKTFNTAVFAAIALAVGFSSAFVTPADAGARKGFYSQDYQFSGPTHGYEGRTIGGYYCSYQRLPNRVCKVVNGVEKCVIKGWTLRQHCY